MGAFIISKVGGGGGGYFVLKAVFWPLSCKAGGFSLMSQVKRIGADHLR